MIRIHRPSLKTIIIIPLICLFCWPLKGFLQTLFTPSPLDLNETWPHLRQYLLTDYFINSLLIGGLSIAGALTLGVSAAYGMVFYQFPLKKYLRWLLIMPLGMPVYLTTYSYALLPMPLGLENLFFSHWGAALMFSICLYPYVYIACLAVFKLMDQSILDAAQTLGRKPVKVILNSVLPAIILSGVAVLVEVLTDFGTVDYLGIPTFATGIYKTWISFNSPWSAFILSAILITGLMMLVLLEQWTKSHSKGQNFSQKVTAVKPSVALQCAWLTFFTLLFCFAFLVPVGSLLITALQQHYFYDLWQPFLTTLTLMAITAIIVMLLAMVCLYGKIWPTFNITAGVLHVIPTVTLAIAFIATGFNTVTGFGFIIIAYAYIIHFAAPAGRVLVKAQQNLPAHLSEAGQTLGASRLQAIYKLEIPLLKPAIIGGMALTSLEVLKELPLALMLRYADFQTLSIKTYQLASDERLEQAAVSGLCMALMGAVIATVYSYINNQDA